MNNSKFYKIRIFDSLLAKFKNQTTQSLSTIIKNCLAQNLTRGTGSENTFFRKIKNFIKSELFDIFFPNSIPNVLEH